jgi:hypothetical protein
VGAGAGGSDDSDGASRHDRDPMGFIYSLRLVSDRKALGGWSHFPQGKQLAGVREKGGFSFFFVAMAGAVR